MTYEEAVEQVARIEAAEVGVNPLCTCCLMDHGRQTEWAIVLQHGFTSCPQCFNKLGHQLFEMGHNVLIPRLPRHGLADRLTDAMAGMNGPELIAAAEQSMDIATGLGRKVAYAGLSLGGVLAAHLATNRADLDRAILIAPFFAAPDLPESVTGITGFVAQRLLPNRFIWWDSKLKEAIPGPRYAYPRFPTKGYGAMLQLGDDVKKAARRQRPRAGELRLVLNAADPGVNNAGARHLIDSWRRHGETVEVYEFARELGLLHDIVSPEQTAQRTDLVYPVLVDWITKDSVSRSG